MLCVPCAVCGLLMHVCTTQLRGQLSMFLSHDWPNLITNYGDKEWLFRVKPHFKEQVRGCSL